MKRTVAGLCAVAAVAGSIASPSSAQEPPERTEQVYIYFYDELGSNSPFNAQQTQLRINADIFAPCRAQVAEPQVSPLIVPLVMFGFNLFARVVENELSRGERRRLAALSRSFSQVRSDPEFSAPAQRFRCLVVERATTVGNDIVEAGATYLFGIRRIGTTAFTVEPVAARVDASEIIDRESPPELNATVSLSYQSIVTDADRANQLVTLPAFAMNFPKIERGEILWVARRASPVMPIAVSHGGARAPTSIAVAVTESHASLERVRERIALEQANRAALVAAMGETLKTAITD